MWGGPAADEPERVEGVVHKDKDDARVSKVGRSAYFSEPPVLTDENGLFVLKDLRRDGSYRLVAEAERGGARATLDEVAAGSRVTLNLEQLGGLDGVVTLDGKPVTDYSIEARGPNTRDKRVVHPEGRFRLDRLDPGTYTLAVTADAGTGTAEVELPQAGRVEVKIVLERAGVLRGEVLGDKDGEPLAGLRIMVMSDSISDTSAGVGLLTGQGPKTDKRGRFEITGVSPGTGTLTFLDPDVQFSSGSTDVAVVEYRLEPGATEDLGTIRGMQGDSVPADERGSLQMALRQAPWAKRPRPPGTNLDAERPDDQADDPTMRLWVYSVDIGGVAEQAGVAPGDEIITIDGRSVAELGAPMAASSLSAARVRVGQEVALELLRGDKRVDLRLEAAPRQP
jgi:hypothetical protein